MTDEPVTEQAEEKPAETDTKAEADATRAEIAAQGTEEAVEEKQQVAAEVKPTTEPETGEEAGDDAAGDGETEDNETEEEKPARKKRSGYARLKARHQAAIAENEALRRQVEEAKSETEAEKPPRLEDFDDDYDAHSRALSAFETGKVVREELSKGQKADAERRGREAAQLAEDEFMERLDDARGKHSDYDAVLQGLQSHVGQLNPDLVSLIQESDQGEHILYHLGKNLSKATRLNEMGIIAAAKTIGSLESTLSMPKPKQGTKAPSPISQVKGGTAPPSTNLEKLAAGDNMKAYATARKAQMTN